MLNQIDPNAKMRGLPGLVLNGCRAECHGLLNNPMQVLVPLEFAVVHRKGLKGHCNSRMVSSLDPRDKFVPTSHIVAQCRMRQG